MEALKWDQERTAPGTCPIQGELHAYILSSFDEGSRTYRKRRIPVLAIAYARPRIPLPMMALLRLKTDIPKEVFPSNWKGRKRDDV